jgi:Transglutaminase-like superfamily
MCFPSLLPTKNVDKYNWEGDLIVNDPIVNAFRKVPGTNKKYKIDVRDFLRTHGNALIDQELREIRDFADKIKAYRQSRKANSSSRFSLSKEPGSFDFRVNMILAYMFERFIYERKEKNDPWLMPEETLRNGKGDCEDFAFLLASLLISSGISSYNVRVALGEVEIESDGDANYASKKFGHAWVMYRQESGVWKVLEPTVMSGKIDKKRPQITNNPVISQNKRAKSTEYKPEFVFNDDHLWIMHDTCKEYDAYSMENMKKTFEGKVQLRWNKLDVAFHGNVHKSIITEVINEANGALDQFSALKNGFLFGEIDRIDNIILHKYDPIEHFDNGYIKEGWDRVEENINKFKANRNDIFPLRLVVHAVADFYAHSTYAHFAQLDPQTNRLPVCDFPNLRQQTNNNIDYLTDPIFANKWTQFSENTPLMNGHDRTDIIKSWKGQLISGRYAQKGDSKSMFERMTPTPNDVFKNDVLLFTRGALPHHNEIAVDSDVKDAKHLLYNDTDYLHQFTQRFVLAKEHITKILKAI